MEEQGLEVEYLDPEEFEERMQEDEEQVKDLSDLLGF